MIRNKLKKNLGSTINTIWNFCYKYMKNIWIFYEVRLVNMFDKYNNLIYQYRTKNYFITNKHQ